MTEDQKQELKVLLVGIFKASGCSPEDAIGVLGEALLVGMNALGAASMVCASTDTVTDVRTEMTVTLEHSKGE